MKVAILILAHKNREQLLMLTEHLRADFDIYVHIDRQSRWTIPEQPNLHVLKNRHSTYWGAYTALLATLDLYHAAYNNGCDYYLLISGQDMPLMKNSDILDFIKTHYEDRLDRHLLPKEIWPLRGGLDRVALFWETKYESNKKSIMQLLMFPVKAAFGLFRYMQRITGLRRSVPFPLWGGEVWMNLTREAVAYILSFTDKNSWYNRHFKFTRCADEIFFHTILSAFDYKGKDNIVNDSMRYIDWSSGPEYPKMLTMEDYEKCTRSGKFFGRKFDIQTDGQVINKLLSAASA